VAEDRQRPAREGKGRMKLKAKPAIQWAVLLFAIFWIVHDPATTTQMVGDVFTFISNFFHAIGSLFSFHATS
jgi:hypothetical protein